MLTIPVERLDDAVARLKRLGFEVTDVKQAGETRWTLARNADGRLAAEESGRPDTSPTAGPRGEGSTGSEESSAYRPNRRGMRTKSDQPQTASSAGELPPISAGFLIYNGEYVPPPYTLEQQGEDLLINGRTIAPQWCVRANGSQVRMAPGTRVPLC